MSPELILLLLAAGPLGVLGAVTGSLGVVTLYAVRRGARDPRDSHQEAAFARPRAGPPRRLYWLGVEGCCVVVGFGLQPLHALLRRRRLWIQSQGRGTPVLLLAGYLENSVQMWLLGRRLQSQGYRVAYLDLRSTLASVAENVGQVRGAIKEICRETGVSQVALVGHSMGGVIGRALAHQEPALLKAVVSLSAPHRGTHLARLGLGASARDLRRGSGHLEAHPPERACPVPLFNLVAPSEWVVSPAWSAVLPHAENLVLEAPAGHLAPLYLRRVARQVGRWLEQAGVERCLR